MKRIMMTIVTLFIIIPVLVSLLCNIQFTSPVMNYTLIVLVHNMTTVSFSSTPERPMNIDM